MTSSNSLIKQQQSLLKDNINEIATWINQELRGGGAGFVVTNLGVDLCDGILLLHLVAHLTHQPVPYHRTNPIGKEQKIDNIKLCLRILQQFGYVIKTHPEDIVGGDINSILSLCNSIMLHHHKKSLYDNNSVDPSSYNYYHHTSNTKPRGGPHKPVKTASIPSTTTGAATVIGKDDIELFQWISNIVNQRINDYTNFYDGQILCDLVNSYQHKAIDYNDLTNLTPIQCLQVAFSAAESHLGLSRGTIDMNKLANGQEDQKLKTYLQHFRRVYLHKIQHQRLIQYGAGSEGRNLSTESYDSLGSLGRNTRRSIDVARPKRATSDAYLNLAQEQTSINRNGPLRHSLSTERLPTNNVQKTTTTGRTSRHQSIDYNNMQFKSLDDKSSSTRNIAAMETTPFPVTIYRTSSRSSIHSTSSRSSIDRNDDHLTLTHLANLTGPSLPPHLLHDGNMQGTVATNNDELHQMVEDLNHRIKGLALLIEDERDKLIRKLLSTVSRERTKRESLEREHKKLLKKANYLMQHYDSCLVDLARDVALMKGQIHDIQMEIATNVPSRDEMVLITNELATLKQQIITTHQVNSQSQQQPFPPNDGLATSGGTSSNVIVTSEKSRKTLFSRKKSDKS